MTFDPNIFIYLQLNIYRENYAKIQSAILDKTILAWYYKEIESVKGIIFYGNVLMVVW